MKWFLALILTSSGSFSQAFEVASVKPSQAKGMQRKGTTGFSRSVDSQQLRYTSVNLRMLVREAYAVQRYQVSGPEWIDSETYDVIAKMPDGAGKDQIPAMMRSLLEERFNLKVRSQETQDRVYVLTASKNGPRLVESKETADRVRGVSFDTSGHMKFILASMASFAESLSNFLDRPVIDQTGLPGTFDIVLNVSMEDLGGMRKLILANGGTTAAVPDSDAPASIFTAMQELGLKLESRTAPIRHIVVESADKIPSGN